MYRLHDSESPTDGVLHVSHQDARHHLVSAANHRPTPEGCNNTPHLINRHCHELTDIKPTHHTVVRLGVFLSNTRQRREKLTTEQRGALADLGIHWATD